MKRIKLAKVFGAVAVSAALALGCAGTALAAGGGWQRSGSDWWYAYDGSGYAASGWERVGGAWYLFDDSGWMETGWQKVSGAWYYLQPGSGAMATGWRSIGGAWYYLNSGGDMATGWKQVGGAWYYLNSGGDMATGWKNLGGTWYYLNGDGDMAEGWKSVGGTWYYLQPGSGAMATGWKQVGSDWYWMDPSGAMAANRWVGDYYVGASGAMATDSWIGGYYVGSDGAWVKGAKPSSGEGQQPSKPSHVHSWQPVFEQSWVEDEPAWDEEVWERRYVCECGYVAKGETGEEMLDDISAHKRQSALDYDAGLVDKWCVNHAIQSVLVGTVHHGATGHYEQVQTGETCSCGAAR